MFRARVLARTSSPTVRVHVTCSCTLLYFVFRHEYEGTVRVRVQYNLYFRTFFCWFLRYLRRYLRRYSTRLVVHVYSTFVFIFVSCNLALQRTKVLYTYVYVYSSPPRNSKKPCLTCSVSIRTCTAHVLLQWKDS